MVDTHTQVNLMWWADMHSSTGKFSWEWANNGDIKLSLLQLPIQASIFMKFVKLHRKFRIHDKYWKRKVMPYFTYVQLGGSNLQKNNAIYFLFCISFQYQHLQWRYLACTLYFLVVTYFPVFIYWSDLVIQEAYNAQFIVKKGNQPVLVWYIGFQRYVPREVCRTGTKLYHVIKNWGHFGLLFSSTDVITTLVHTPLFFMRESYSFIY
jgi:hypothetical protein